MRSRLDLGIAIVAIIIIFGCNNIYI